MGLDGVRYFCRDLSPAEAYVEGQQVKLYAIS